MHQCKTKKEAIAHFKRYLNEARCWQPLAGDALEDLLWLIARHPSASEKIGCGIAAVYVRRNPVFPSQRSFWIQRTDGSETDFSYLLCLNGKDRSSQQWFSQACRWSVTAQILEFKRRAFAVGRVLCSVTGQPVDWHSCHVDHEAPQFSEMVDAFVREHQIDVASVEIAGHADGDCSARFASQAMDDLWSEYHRTRAALRIVTTAVNLRRKRPKR